MYISKIDLLLFYGVINFVQKEKSIIFNSLLLNLKHNTIDDR